VANLSYKGEGIVGGGTTNKSQKSGRAGRSRGKKRLTRIEGKVQTGGGSQLLQ